MSTVVRLGLVEELERRPAGIEERRRARPRCSSRRSARARARRGRTPPRREVGDRQGNSKLGDLAMQDQTRCHAREFRARTRVPRAEIDFSRATRRRTARRAGHDAIAHDRCVIVGQRSVGHLEREVDRDRLAALAHLVTVVDVEDARLTQLGRSCLEDSVDERGGLDLLGHDHRDVLAERREGDHIVVEDPLRDRRCQLEEVELEDAPRAIEQRRMKLTEPSRRRGSGLPRVEERRTSSRRGAARDGVRRRSPRPHPARW